MSATATVLPTARPIVLPDPRPARGKHRAPRLLADRMLAWSRRQRGAWLLTATTVGALLAPVVLP